MKPSHAADMLRVSLDNLTEDHINAAFAEAVKASHPDLGGAGNIYALKAARDVLRQELAKAPRGVCLTCRGKGVVKTSMFSKMCESCEGRGYQ